MQACLHVCHPCSCAALLLLLQYDEMYKRSIEDPNGFWGDIAKEFHWEKQVRGHISCVTAMA